MIVRHGKLDGTSRDYEALLFLALEVLLHTVLIQFVASTYAAD